MRDFADEDKWPSETGMSRTMTGTTVEINDPTANHTGHWSGFNYFVDLSATINRCPGCEYLLVFWTVHHVHVLIFCSFFFILSKRPHAS